MTWQSVLATIVSVATILGFLLALADYLAGRRERQQNRERSAPRIQATINADDYGGGWRSVQLHVVPLDEAQQDFRVENWRIDGAKLLRPRTAVLARAADDDYASGVFYPEHPVRMLEGRPAGNPQQFALEFFIKFSDAKNEQIAVFKVTFSHLKSGKRFTAKVSAFQPPDH